MEGRQFCKAPLIRKSRLERKHQDKAKLYDAIVTKYMTNFHLPQKAKRSFNAHKEAVDLTEKYQRGKLLNFNRL